MNTLKTTVQVDEFTEYASKAFDFKFTGESTFTPHEVVGIPEKFAIGLIVGSSGSGKSTLLKTFGTEHTPLWDNNKAIVSHFTTPEEAVSRLSATGLNSIPTWMKPYHVLSTGEKFRADLARSLNSNAIIDEFTSVVNREVAISTSIAISKYITKNKLSNIVFSSCHKDILPYLNPDWVYNTDTCELPIRRLLPRPEMELKIYRTTWKSWNMFKNHHYLSQDLNKACRCFIGVLNGQVVAFNASISLPGRIPPLYEGDTRNKFRESRTVVLPDYQGMGIGTKFSNAIGEMFLDEGYRYFSKTAHPRMGEYRQNSLLWRPTATNLKSREKAQKRSKKEVWHRLALDTKRLCYSHEYLGSHSRYDGLIPSKALEKFLKRVRTTG